MQFWSALATALQTRDNFSPEMISRIAPTLLFVLATIVSAKELAVVQKDFQRTVRPVLQKFCFDCHGENKSKAGIRVDYLDGTVPDKEVRHWEIIRKQLLEEEMPPEDEAQPSKADRAALVAWIDGALQMARTTEERRRAAADGGAVPQHTARLAGGGGGFDRGVAAGRGVEGRLREQRSGDVALAVVGGNVF